MGENIILDPEHLLAFLWKLKEVFDVCDEDSDGFIHLEHLVSLGSQFGQGEQVRFSNSHTWCRSSISSCCTCLVTGLYFKFP